MDKVTSAIIADRMAKYGGFADHWGGHTGIGTLPIVYFGTEEQKKKYLPKLATGEMDRRLRAVRGASGSDALNAAPAPMLSPDGKHYILNGEKMWITNAGFADLFTVFAKVDGEKFTAFLVERDFPGFSVGAEEHKMGIRGSSTCPLILNDCKVPVENLLGEIGKGHNIAFNILNIGRFKLGAACVGGARTVAGRRHRVRQGAQGVRQDHRRLRPDPAKSWPNGHRHLRRRVAGLPHRRHDRRRARRSRQAGADAAQATFAKRIEEYAVECSILKVWGSEMLDYGRRRDRADLRRLRLRRGVSGRARLSRLAHQSHLRRHQRDQPADHHRMAAEARHDRTVAADAGDQEADGRSDGRPGDERRAGRSTGGRTQDLVANAKKLALFAAGAASQKYMQALADQQEVMGAIADMLIEVYAMESCRAARAEDGRATRRGGIVALAVAMTQVYLSQAMDKIEAAAKKIIAAVADGDMLRTQLAILRRLVKHEPFNTIELRQQIAQKGRLSGEVHVGVEVTII